MFWMNIPVGSVTQENISLYGRKHFYVNTNTSKYIKDNPADYLQRKLFIAAHIKVTKPLAIIFTA